MANVEGGAVRSKRANGEGTKPKLDPKTGLWAASLMVGYRANGKPDRRRVKAKTQGECLRKRDELRAKIAAGTLGDAGAGRETVSAFLLRWLESIDGTRRESSIYRYRVIVEKHLVPAIGRHRLADLRPEHLVKMYAEARKSGKRRQEKDGSFKIVGGLSHRSVKYLHTTIRLALDKAVAWSAGPRNVARSVDPPRVPRKIAKAMLPSEVATLLASADAAGDRLAALWTVAAFSGAREGELLGLRWADVSFDTATISIKRAQGDGPADDGETKTRSGVRTITLDSEAMEALRSHRERQRWDRQALGSDYGDLNLVFASAVGTPLDASNVVHHFKRALKRAGLPTHYSPHSLRHANATLQLLTGVQTKVTSERLGHSTVQITQDLYQHVLREMDVTAATKIGDALRAARAPAV